MLYQQWRKIAGERRQELALLDIESGRCWTFGELFAAGENWIVGPGTDPANAGFAFPQDRSPEFIFKLLAAWRENAIVCPLEAGQWGASIVANCHAAPLDPAIVHLKTTSGTGGTARWVAFTATQLMADAENIVTTMGLRPDWPNLGVISLAHSYGFSNLVLPLLLHGIPLLLAPAPLPEIIRRTVDDWSAITLPAVPAMWRAWQAAGAIPPNVRLAISAGAPLAPNLEQEIFKSCGVKLHNFLGSSECGGIAYDASETPRSDTACVGSPVQNVHLSVNRDGCLMVRSQAVAETYWPEKADSLGDGRFCTSDLAELKDGLVFLHGRQGDQINMAGRKVSPETIERALLKHPRVRECLVFGVPSRELDRTEIITAVVASDAAGAELKNFLLQTLPVWQVPREWHFVDTLPVNARGKISRADWRRNFSAGTAA